MFQRPATVSLLNLDGTVPSSILNVIGVNTRRRIGCELPKSALPTAVEVNVFDVESMDVTWNIAEDCEADIDEKVGAAACYHEDAHWGKEDGDEDYEEGGRGVRHGGSLEMVALFLVALLL